VDGNTAKGTWALYLFWSEPEVKWVQGRQECEYEKINGEWKIKSNKYIRPWPVGPDTFPKD
jgi:hypothetical protein